MRPLNQTAHLGGTDLVNKYLLSFGIGLKDSGVKADNVIDMTAEYFITKEI